MYFVWGIDMFVVFPLSTVACFAITYIVPVAMVWCMEKVTIIPFPDSQFLENSRVCVNFWQLSTDRHNELACNGYCLTITV